MKQHTQKGLSALCIVLALCMTLQSTTLAADLSADTTVTSTAVSEEADATESTETLESAEAEEEEETEEAEEEALETVEETGETEEEVSAEEEPEADASAEEDEETEETSAEPEEEAEAEEENDETEADTVVTVQSTTENGWVQVPSNGEDAYWTFYYKETSSATASTQAMDVVLCLPESCTVNSTTFSEGYYYFDGDGKLVADGETASVGTIKALKNSSGTYVCDTSAADAGHVMKVVTTQATEEDGTVTVSSSASYYSGKYSVDGLHYSNGTLYTGFYRTSAGFLYYITNGSAAKYTGKYDTSNSDTYGSTTYTGDGLWYYNGSKFTGYARTTSSTSTVWVVTNGKGGTKLTGQMSSSTAYVRMDTGKKSTGDDLWYYQGTKYTGYIRRTSSDYVWVVTNGKGGTKLTGQMSSSTAYLRVDTGVKSTGDGLWYYNGSKFTGYIRRSSSDYVWAVTNGKGGTKLTGVMSTSKYYLRSDTGKRSKGDGKCYSNGVLYTGGYGGYYYKKGVKVTGLSGWKTFDSSGNTSSKAADNTYYFSGGKYLTGWNNVKRNGTTYRYYFNSDGTLCKNLYKVSSAWKKKDTKLVISRSTHTATLYAKYNGSYKIPTKSFVVSTSKLSSNFKVGTYKLTSRKTWFTISTTRWWYKWATYISGSGSWIHSEQYYTKGNSKSLRVSSYNDLGTNQSKQCIRMQVVNAKLIYDMKGYGSIKTVVLNKSSNAGPFGKMTITNNVDRNGKLSGTKSYDPTDPLYT